jgi:hypothetical protein
MRDPIRSIIVAAAVVVAGCGSKEDAREEARKEAEALDQKAEAPKPAEKKLPPVPGEQRVPCEQLIDPAAFQSALGETDPLVVKDATAQDAEAAASCGLVKGGEKLDAKAQEALAKKTNHRLGVLPGDDICNITAYCWTVETEENFKTRCKQKGLEEDTSMGNFACVQIVAQGADDVKVYRFFDADTKCILQARGGPSNVDNDKILACANTARDTITPERIKVAPPTP